MLRRGRDRRVAVLRRVSHEMHRRRERGTDRFPRRGRRVARGHARNVLPH
jgi:hypothetical protein